MDTMTLEDLLRILTECAGAADGVADGTGGTNLADTTFEDLGYDSLALIETAARIAQDYGVEVPDEDLTELETPRALLDLVNRGLAQAS